MKKVIFSILALLGMSSSCLPFKKSPSLDSKNQKLKIYWFIPDGLRAEPAVFKIYEWADKGLLPNIKKMMDEGSYGYSRPYFPSHTPTNFASLFTGAPPAIHGIADGPMRTEGKHLKTPSIGGFSSSAKKIPAIWSTFEDNGFQVSLLSVPGSTPPEINEGYVVKGRWGNWGIEIPSITFNSELNSDLKNSPYLRSFFKTRKLSSFVSPQKPKDWKIETKSYSPAFEIELKNAGATVYALVIDGSDNNQVDYDTLILSLTKEKQIARLGVGETSPWHPITLNRQDEKGPLFTLDTQFKLRVIQLQNKKMFRLRLIYNGMNKTLVQPENHYAEIMSSVGPMDDYVDDFPAQLIFYKNDKQAFLSELRESMEWHRKMAAYMVKNHKSDVIIHNIYSPNQMLTSRWWLGYVDPVSPLYKTISETERQKIWDEVLELYKGMDKILGEALKRADKNTLVVLSSDHGAIPVAREVRLNNYLKQKGYIKTKRNPDNKLEIDWDKSRAVFLKMNHIYISPNGLGGNYKRSTGKAYEKLRNSIIDDLKKLKDQDGTTPLAKVVTWENAGELNLPTDRVGDLVIANTAGHGWMEEITDDGVIFINPLVSGYKQAILPEESNGLLTPFVIWGPGVKKGHKLSRIIKHKDQYSTILNLMGIKIPEIASGEILHEIKIPNSVTSN